MFLIKPNLTTPILMVLTLAGCTGSHPEVPVQAGRWTNPVELQGSSRSNTVHVHSAAVSDQGRGLVTWSATDTEMKEGTKSWCRAFQPDGSWVAGSPVTFAPEPNQSHQPNPDGSMTPFLVDGTGEGWIVGLADGYFHQGLASGWAGTLPAAVPVRDGAPVDHARPIGPLRGDLAGFQAAGNRRGTLVSSWLEQGLTGKPRLFVNRFIAGKGWDAAPAELPLPEGMVYGKYLAATVTDEGTAFLAWVTESCPTPGPSQTNVWVASAKAGQEWSEPLQLAHSGPIGLSQLSLAAGSGDRAAIAWTRIERGATTTNIEVSQFRPEGGWSHPDAAVQLKGAILDGTTLCYTGTDQLLLAFLASDQPDSIAHQVRTTSFSAGLWSAPTTHSRPSRNPSYAIGSDGKGHALLVWRQEGEHEGQAATARASIALSNTAWQPSVTLSAGPSAEGSVEHLSATMGPDGTACAVWDTRQESKLTGWASIFKPGWKAD